MAKTKDEKLLEDNSRFWFQQSQKCWDSMNRARSRRLYRWWCHAWKLASKRFRQAQRDWDDYDEEQRMSGRMRKD